jgi:hypothetical protein
MQVVDLNANPGFTYSKALRHCCVVVAWMIPLILLADEPGALRPLADRNQMLETLAESIGTAVRRTDTLHSIFHGCIDWHSAVHGHWALMRIAATTGKDDQLANWVVAALTPDEIAAEAKYLRQHPDFEMPYGRAWFLRLAIEFETWGRQHRLENPTVLKTMADEVATSLDERYQKLTPTPNSREYGNDSWALVQLYSFYQHRGDEAGMKRVSSLIQDHFVNSNANLSFADDFRRPEFFSRFGNWAYLIAHTQDDPAVSEFWKAHPASDNDLKPIEPAGGVAHYLGMNWSRAWALKAIASKIQDPKEQKRLERAYSEHVASGMALHEKSKDDYRNYGHWVPQFAVYAITE